MRPTQPKQLTSTAIMAVEQPPDNPDRFSEARRKRLVQCFDHAMHLMEKGEYDFEYVTDLLGKCVAGDPAKVEHVDNFLTNLYRKFKDRSKVSPVERLRGIPTRHTLKKAVAAKDWAHVPEHAVELLKKDPWDSVALTALATLAENLNYDETERRCLKAALESNPKDPEINRQCALAAAKRGLYDQAIACWHRVEKARPDAEEPPKEIQKLTLMKSAAHSSFEDVLSTRPSGNSGSMPAYQAAASSADEKLKRQIAANPEELEPYLALADLYNQEERFREAEATLTKAVEVSGGRQDIKERLEDARLTNLQSRIRAAEKQAKTSGTEEDLQEHKRLRRKLKVLELEIYKARVERYPTNLGFKHELGLRYQAVGDYKEAIKQFQLARNDPRRRGMCLLALGQCFQQIKQGRLAMDHYDQAVAEIPDRETDNKKLALYHAGWLALRLKDRAAARRHLTALANLDFGYKDVAALLDKTEELEQDNDNPPAPEPDPE